MELKRKRSFPVVDDALGWKTKYLTIEAEVDLNKEKFERRISQLESELVSLHGEIKLLQQQLYQSLEGKRAMENELLKLKVFL